AKGELIIAEFKEGDYLLRSEVLVDGAVCASSEQTISLAAKLSDRLKVLKQKDEALKEKPASVEKGTLKHLRSLLDGLAARKTLETNFPAGRLLREADEAAAAAAAGTASFP